MTAEFDENALLAAARAALMAHFHFEPCDVPSSPPFLAHGPVSELAFFYVRDDRSHRLGSGTYVAVNRTTGKAIVFESGE